MSLGEINNSACCSFFKTWPKEKVGGASLLIMGIATIILTTSLSGGLAHVNSSSIAALVGASAGAGVLMSVIGVTLLKSKGSPTRE